MKHMSNNSTYTRDGQKNFPGEKVRGVVRGRVEGGGK